ncbi:hypothetical protein GCM10010171_56580 [Actinokineospora fastidiosa]|uniref:Uncharacterized protein n=1 Tax=Actinokineospora fastidiosa TaxID=1816 RepID=A0A918LIH1_9PSEU|nr:hypothetical protein GCM10010171_56580 [Actinokineospora fastidiosa]
MLIAGSVVPVSLYQIGFLRMPALSQQLAVVRRTLTGQSDLLDRPRYTDSAAR